MNRQTHFTTPPYIVLMEDPIVHTDDRPFCWDSGCPCHSDESEVLALNDQIAAGLLTAAEAARLYYDCQVN